ncbi:hypothetical protein L226DRAFT_574172 [Lentinus tigrinus ALCF2SS1-7]|uniref:Sodium/calcium exchanger membrane region domain-containing protein n=1 Tax=Lentinus tigrinus ALCF2SS1-6 TaxID=1328759 RepID=A0A5C2S0A9_9APHY|nr:hypothetical protein L227DRAFT_614194 [Lentinus tigrinus ALCF2SS1-6]RPD71167.1 hypothetical protein L226DRAFT_574172 [Lentinus tigrinus ALCF2SS1-7]
MSPTPAQSRSNTWDEEKMNGTYIAEVPAEGEWGLRNINYPGWQETVRHIYGDTSPSNPSAWLHALLLAIPFAWVSHFVEWHHNATFVLCFVAMIPLQKIFDWGGEKLGEYVGKDLKDLLVITLSNAIEAALAIILLLKCELRLLQSTIIGVVLLHLLLVPGTAFFVQGALLHEQRLDPNHNSLNHSLSMMGVLGILVPTIFFAALDRGDVTNPTTTSVLPPAFVPLVSDAVRGYMLQISRGIAIILPTVYVTSRLWRHQVLPGHRQTAFGQPAGTAFPSARDPTTKSTHPRIVNPWVCVALILLAVGFMIPTAEFLVSSIEDVRESSGIQIEWFGIILLPLLSFSADGVVVIWKWSVDQCENIQEKLRKWILELRSISASSPQDLPSGRVPQVNWRPINLSIRFQDESATPDLGHVVSDTAEMSQDGQGSSAQRLNIHFKDQSNSSAAFWVALPSGQAVSATTGAVEPGRWRPIDLNIQFKDELPGDSGSGTAEKSQFDAELAHWRPIDLSIQFMLWWTPFLVLLGWWTGRPMHLLFDYFEVGLLVGACFLVNYVTVDGKTNVSEGFTMIAFYVMIAMATWFYPGQPQVGFMLNCPGTVAEAVASGAELMQ